MGVDYQPKSYRAFTKILGWYQIIGGTVGFYVMINLFIVVQFIFILQYCLLAFGFLLCSYSIFAGIKLLLNAKKGLLFSKINQCFQLLNISILRYSFFYCAGIYFCPTIDLADTSFLLHFGASTFTMILNLPLQVSEVGINIIALFLIILIDSFSKQFKLIELPEFDIEKQ